MRNRRITLFVAAAAVLVLAALSSPAPAASGTWTGTASGNWSDIGNWSGTIADGATFTADLSTIDQTGDITVTMDSSRTLAILNIGDTNNTNSYTIAGTGGGTLTLDNYGATAQLNQLATSKGDTLDASLPIILGSNLEIRNSSANGLAVNGGVSAGFAGAKIISNLGTGTGAVTLGGNVTDGTGRVYITQNSANSMLALTGTNTYTGWTIITAGILRAPGAGLSPNTWIQINGGVLESSGTIARNIGNTYRNVFWNANGGFAAYGGDLTVTLNGGQTVDWANTTQGFNGKTLIFGSATATDKVTMTNNIALKAARTIQVKDNTGSANDMVEFSGILADGGTAGGLTKTGNGVLILSSANTYTGATTLSAGTLVLKNSIALQNSTLTMNGGGSSLVFDSSVVGNAFTFGGLAASAAGAGYNIALQNNAVSPVAVALTVGGNNASTTYAGVLSGAGSLTKAGTGTLTLSGANTFTGGVTLSAGKLTLGHNNALGGAAGTFTINSGGTLDVNAARTTPNNNPVTINGDFTFAGTNTLNLGTGAISLGTAGGISRTITVNASTLTLGGVIANGSTANSLVKAGAGTLVLSGANTYTGSTDISAGTLTIGNVATFNNTSQIALSGTGRLDVNVASQSLAKLVTGVPAGTFLRYSQVQTAGGTGPGTILGTVELNITNVNPNYTLDFGGGSKLTNTIAAIYTSGITLSGDASIDSSTAVFTGTGMTISASTAGAKTLTFTGTNTGANTIGGIISDGSDTVGVAKTGAGAWAISGANTYTGPTNISAGTLTIGNVATFNNTSQIALSGTGRLDVNVANQSLAKLVTGGGVPAGTFLRYSQAQAGGTGPGTILGTVELNLTNVNPGYTLDFGGGSKLTNVIAATYNSAITLSGDASIDSSSAVFTGGAAMTISASTAGAKTLTFTGTNIGANTIGGIISDGSDTVGITKTGAGTWVLSGANSYSGGTTVSAGVLTAAGAASLPGYDSAGKVVFNGGTVGVAVGGAGWTTGQVNTLLTNATKTSGALGIDTTNGSLTQWTAFTTGNFRWALGLNKLGANTLILDQANTYAGTTTVSAGVLNIRNGAALGSTAGGTTVASGAALELQGGIMVGAEALSLNGTGIAAGGALRNISGDNTYGGLITLAGASRINSDAGTLTLDVASGNAVTGTNLALTLGGAGNITVADPIVTGTGTLIKDGAGTAILAGNNTYTGLTTVSAGTLTLSGNNTGTGGTTLTAGTLNVNHDHALGNSGTITLTSGTVNNTSGAAITNSVANPITIGGNFTFGGTNGLNLGTGAVTNAGDRTITLNGTGTTLTLGGTMTNTKAGVQTTTVNGAGNALVLGGYALSNSATSYVNVINGSGNVTITGPVTNGSTATASGLTYSGTGVLTLSGASTYAGATAVSAGTLKVNGSINSSAATASNVGSVLAGGGSVKSLTVNSAAIVAPGDGVGTLAVATGGFATLNSGAVYQWELGSISADLVNIAGNLTLDNAWTLKLVDAGGTPVVSTQYNLFTYTGTYTGLATFGLSNIDATGVSWNTTGASIVAGGGFVYITGIGPSGMAAPAIPEPATAMLLVFGAAALLRRRRIADAA